MRSNGARVAGLLPALGLIGGATAALFTDDWLLFVRWLLPLVSVAAAAAWARRAQRATMLLLSGGFAVAGAVLCLDARAHALHSPLRAVLDREFDGFAIETAGPEGDHDPVVVRAVLVEDAAPREEFVSLRAEVVGITVGKILERTEGEVSLSVNGRAAAEIVTQWRAGRTIVAPVRFRRPARYLNDGVPDFERDLALDGTTLFGSIKSGLLVQVVERGTIVDELAADVRAHVRRAIGRWVGPHDAVAAAIVTWDPLESTCRHASLSIL